MDFSEHLVISGAGSAAILAGGGGWESAAAFSVFGVFVDLDHLPDYWRETGFNTDIPYFMTYHQKRQVQRLLLILHGWEIVALAALAVPFFGLPSWCAWAVAGWLVHLVLDHQFNRLHKLAYFFSYRIKHGFKAEAFYGD